VAATKSIFGFSSLACIAHNNYIIPQKFQTESLLLLLRLLLLLTEWKLSSSEEVTSAYKILS
jgi:hypothetical protein